jgi:phospholipase/lecithinase/hemolysin
MSRLRCVISFFMCFVFVQTASAQVANFDAMYVFGDSLSDNGNDLILSRLFGAQPAIPPSESPNRTYYRGRFSNGPVAFEYLWQLIKQNPNAIVKPSFTFALPSRPGAINYAFGGATSGVSAITPGGFPVPGLLGQVEALRFGLFGRRPPERSLFALWIGANDYAVAVPADPTVVVNNIKLAIQRLYRIGGRQFIVLNMPNLGQTPIAQAQGLGDALAGLSQFHNALLAQAVSELSASLPGVRITSIDVFTLAQNVFGSTYGSVPALGALAPGSESCLLLNPASCPDVPLSLTERFFYWDVEHPTTEIHRILGQAMYDALPR